MEETAREGEAKGGGQVIYLFMPPQVATVLGLGITAIAWLICTPCLWRGIGGPPLCPVDQVSVPLHRKPMPTPPPKWDTAIKRKAARP